MACPRLDELQHAIVEALTSPIPLTADSATSAVALLRPSARGMTPASRLEVYREQFWIRHLANLTDDYPTLRWVLGQEQFEALLRDYLVAFPPATWNLQRLGEKLPDFVATRTPWSEDAIARDAAALDWAFMEVFDAPDSPLLDLTALAAATPDAWPLAKIAFIPALRLVGTDHPVHDLRDAVRAGRECTRPLRSPTQVVVWRDAGCFLRVASIDAQAARLLLELQSGRPLGDACASVTASDSAVDAELLGSKVGAWFQDWTARGWVGSVAL